MITLDNSYPTELMQEVSDQPQAATSPASEGPQTAPSAPLDAATEAKIVSYVVDWKNKLKRHRAAKVTIWNECWQLYRGLEDFQDKEEWQSKIVLPKAWSSVKQATSTVKRLLATSKAPWQVEPVNPDDLVLQIRAEQMGNLTRVFLDKAKYMDEFAEGLECGFIIGVGIWKLWWALTPRVRTRVRVGIVGEDGQFQEISEAEGQQIGAPMQRQLVREEVVEGALQVRAVDPYNFFWLPGSKLNKWAGTIEEIEVPRWELYDMAQQGMLDEEKIKDIQPMKITEDQKQQRLRFSELPDAATPSPETDAVKLTEFYGPLIIEGELLERNAHVLIANDNKLLLNQQNQLWTKKPPYVGFSPLTLPFRTEGVGLLEMVRQIDKALSRLANMSIDTLLFKLMPLFEINLEAYENPEDLETGLTPGKMLRRNGAYLGQPGIVPVQFEDISQGSVQVQAALDRYHQEGALVSEIQQAIPRYRGVQTATEIQEKSENQDSFFGAMATDIEQQALQPMVELATELILQYIDTANDPRIASVLGVNADTFKSISREELIEMVQGDYQIKVTGITSQLQKAEMLQNLVQLMNILGQNPEAWMPYVNQDNLLRRMLEAFRPTIREIEDIVAEPALVEARKAAASQETLSPELIGMIPQLVQMAVQQQNQQQQMQQEQAMQQQQMMQQQQQAANEANATQQQQDHEIAIEAMRADAQASQPEGEV